MTECNKIEEKFKEDSGEEYPLEIPLPKVQAQKIYRIPFFYTKFGAQLYLGPRDAIFYGHTTGGDQRWIKIYLKSNSLTYKNIMSDREYVESIRSDPNNLVVDNAAWWIYKSVPENRTEEGQQE